MRNREEERKLAGGVNIAMSIFGVVFSIFWCCMALAMGAWFMLIFGIPFVGFMIFRLTMCFKMMKAEKESPKPAADPWERPAATTSAPAGSGYCPFCGAAMDSDFRFCPKCGRSR